MDGCSHRYSRKGNRDRHIHAEFVLMQEGSSAMLLPAWWHFSCYKFTTALQKHGIHISKNYNSLAHYHIMFYHHTHLGTEKKEFPSWEAFLWAENSRRGLYHIATCFVQPKGESMCNAKDQDHFKTRFVPYGLLSLWASFNYHNHCLLRIYSDSGYAALNDQKLYTYRAQKPSVQMLPWWYTARKKKLPRRRDTYVLNSIHLTCRTGQTLMSWTVGHCRWQCCQWLNTCSCAFYKKPRSTFHRLCDMQSVEWHTL